MTVPVLDKVTKTRAHENPYRCNRIHRTTTMDNLTNSDHYQLKVMISNEAELTQVMNAITNVHKMIQGTTKEPKLVQTQISIFKGQKSRYNDFELLPLNHTQLFQHKMTEEQKLLLFEKLLREDDIEL